ncbi:MAG: HAD-IC family P-type ATPase [Saprospiraceae bacterium]|nr:HAD-IC family P-type ATPase [Saprospiraceae bacterium]
MDVFAFTSVLIIACPCVIALSIPFTYGSLLSLLSMRSIFLKNTSTIEKLQSVDTFVFDKTGTITSGKKPEVEYIGRVLTWDQKKAITTLTQQSSHPMSRFVEQFLDLEMISDESLEDFQEITGKGLQGNIDGHRYRIGSGTWVKKQDRSVSLKTGEVHVSEDDQYLGCFKIITKYRPDLNLVLAELRKMGKVFLLTGDNAFQSVELKQEFGFEDDEMYFDQSPLDKKQWIENLQKSGHRVMMIGDGLNDSGALLSSDVGIVVTEDLNNFTPASDVVIQSENFRRLPELFSILFSVRKILFFLYLMAILYNAVGLYFAVQGLLSPVVAAILMPTSSISMVVAGYLLTRWSVNRRTRSWGREIFRLQQPRPNYAVS